MFWGESLSLTASFALWDEERKDPGEGYKAPMGPGLTWFPPEPRSSAQGSPGGSRAFLPWDILLC